LETSGPDCCGIADGDACCEPVGPIEDVRHVTTAG